MDKRAFICVYEPDEETGLFRATVDLKGTSLAGIFPDGIATVTGVTPAAVLAELMHVIGSAALASALKR